MRLIKCYIENFGLINQQSFDFDKSLCVFHSDNGTGKTTLTQFLMSMLYGIGDTRRTSLSENERKKYMPWQGGKFGGSLTFEAQGKLYTVERSFGQRVSDDTFKLIDAKTGAPSSDFSENLGEDLFSIDRDGFLRTVFLSERNLTGKNENKTISAKLSDLVGVDGDLGEFDKAIDLLDEKRKFYYKKGGAGEISNIRTKLFESERKLEALDNIKLQISLKNEAISSLKNEINSIENEKSVVEKKISKISEESTKRAYAERYQNIAQEIEKEQKELEKLKLFFKMGVPSLASIDRAREDFLEGKRLSSETLYSNPFSNEYEYSSFFKYEPSQEEITLAQQKADLLKDCQEKIAILEKSGAEHSTDKKAASTEELSKKLSTVEKGRTAIFYITLGAFVLAAALLLALMIHPAICFAALIGIALLSIGAIRLSKAKQEEKEILQYAKALGLHKKKATDAIYALLYSNRENHLNSEHNSLNIEELYLKKEKLITELSEFLNCFPLDLTDIPSAVERLKEAYIIYRHKKGEREKMSEIVSQAKQRAEALNASAQQFLQKYPTTTDNPFDELRERVQLYSYKEAVISKLKMELDELEIRHGINKDVKFENSGSHDNLFDLLSKIDGQLDEKRREYALLNREQKELSDIYSERPSLAMQRDELKEQLNLAVKNLEIIQMTISLINEASSNMTSRYIGKTKERFIEYEACFGGCGGEFMLDTSFCLSKNDKGSSRTEESYSRGTRDMYALAIRLALIDSLYEDERPFIILDDPFISFDDKRLQKALILIKKLSEERQVIYFTCSKSRAI